MMDSVVHLNIMNRSYKFDTPLTPTNSVGHLHSTKKIWVICILCPVTTPSLVVGPCVWAHMDTHTRIHAHIHTHTRMQYIHKHTHTQTHTRTHAHIHTFTQVESLKRTASRLRERAGTSFMFCCSVLQRVAACCSVLQRVAACCLRERLGTSSVCIAVCCGVL